MATGLYLLQGGSVMVAYGYRRIPISRAQYQANGYSPALEKLAAKAPVATKPPSRSETASQGGRRAPSSEPDRSRPREVEAIRVADGEPAARRG